jgi:hypothetical protein
MLTTLLLPILFTVLDNPMQFSQGRGRKARQGNASFDTEEKESRISGPDEYALLGEDRHGYERH